MDVFKILKLVVKIMIKGTIIVRFDTLPINCHSTWFSLILNSSMQCLIIKNLFEYFWCLINTSKNVQPIFQCNRFALYKMKQNHLSSATAYFCHNMLFKYFFLFFRKVWKGKENETKTERIVVICWLNQCCI
jgi:hypothetical protein